MKPKDITGQVFGRLTVVEYAGSVNHKATWRCTCSCGSTAVLVGGNLRSGVSTSCGCIRKEKCAGLKSKGGVRKHPLYETWASMKARCYNEKNNSYEWYGAKGIGICQEWRENFKSFMAWATTSGWAPGLQIDRLKSDVDYGPGNCQWLSPSEHSKKTRKENP